MKPIRSAYRMPVGRRLSAIVLVVAALITGACGADTGTTGNSATSAADAPEIAELGTTLLTLEDRYDVRYGIAAYEPARGKTFHWNAGDRFGMGSVFTVYAVAAVLRLAERGELDLNERVPIDPENIVPNSPTTSYHAGETLSWYELSRAALVRSDGTAANMLLRRLGGPRAVTDLARTVGDTETRLDRWEPTLNEATPGDPRDTSTAAALATGYHQLLLGGALDTVHRRMLTGWLRSSVTSRERIRAGLPLGWVAADKAGGGSYGAANAAGVVWGPTGRSFVLVIFSRSTIGYPTAAPADVAVADAATAVLKAMSK
ncbi:class A beta-lactamase [Nocardia sp. X0981]